MLFEEVAGFYLENSQHRSKERDHYSLNRLLPYFKSRLLDEIRRADVRTYVRHRQAQGVKLATVRRELRFACAAVNFTSVELELELKNPFQSLNIPDSEHRVRWITKDQAVRLVHAAGLYARTPLLRCFIILALNTGCRRGELLRLEWCRVDQSRAMLFLEAAHTKTAKRRTVPLNAASLAAIEELERYRDESHPDSPWVFPSSTGGHIRWLKTGFRSACKRAGLVDLRIHDLRHTCASWLVMAGVDLYVIRDLLGHSSVTQTEKYAHLAPDRIASAVSLLEK